MYGPTNIIIINTTLLAHNNVNIKTITLTFLSAHVDWPAVCPKDYIKIKFTHTIV